jgi:hypothetical protein
MDSHVKTLGILNILFGVVGGLGALVILLTMGGFGGFYFWAEGSGGYGFLAIGLVIFHLALAIPCLLGGIFILQYHEWARLVMIIVSALNVLNMPFGAAIGAYGLWVLLQPETEPLFLDPVLRAARSPARQAANRGTSRPPKQREPNSERVQHTIKPARTNLPE